MASIQFDASLDTSKLDQSIEENKKSLATWLEDVRKLGAEFDQIFAKIGEAKNIDIQVNKDSAIQQVNDLTTSINDIAPTVPVTVEVENVDQSQKVMEDYVNSLASDFTKIDQAYWQNNTSAQQSIEQQTQLVSMLSKQVEELEAQMANVGQTGGLQAGSEQVKATQTSLAATKEQLTKASDHLTNSMEIEIGKFGKAGKEGGGFNSVLKGLGSSLLKMVSWTAAAGVAVKIFQGAMASGGNAADAMKANMEGLQGALGQFFTQVRQGSLDNYVVNMIMAAKAAKQFQEAQEQYNKSVAASKILNTADAAELAKLEAIYRNSNSGFEARNKALQEWKKIKIDTAKQDVKNAQELVTALEEKIRKMPGLSWVKPEDLKLMETIYYESGNLMKMYDEIRSKTKGMSLSDFLDEDSKKWKRYTNDVREERANLTRMTTVKGLNVMQLAKVDQLETELSKKSILGLGQNYELLGQSKAKIPEVDAQIARTSQMVQNSYVGEEGSIGRLMQDIQELEKLKKEVADKTNIAIIQRDIDIKKEELNQIDPEKKKAAQKEIDQINRQTEELKAKQRAVASNDPQKELKLQLANLKRQYDADIAEDGISKAKKAALTKKYLAEEAGLYKDYYNDVGDKAKDALKKTTGGFGVLAGEGKDHFFNPETDQQKNKDALKANLAYLEDQQNKELAKTGLFEKDKVDIAKKYTKLRLDVYKKFWQDSGRAEDAGQLRGLSQTVLDANERLKQQMAEQAEKAEMLAPALYGASDAAQYLSGLFNQGNEEIAGMLQGFGKLSGMAADWYKKGYFNLFGNLKTMGKGEAMSNIIGGATDIVGMFVNQSQENKAKMKQYYDYVIQQQADYNLLLNEQIRLNSEQSGNVFLSDYVGKITDGTKAYNDAMQKYYAGIKELSKAQAVAGMGSALSGANVLKGAAGGASLGAGIGTMIMPAIGTAIGAGIGAVVGGIAGLFAKKKKDIMQPLLAVYPDLIKANGELNLSLAQTILDNNLIADGSRQVLQNIVDWKKAAEEAEAQIEGVISDLAGALGSELSNALVKAFTDGTDSAVAFGNTVDKILSDIMAQLVFNAVFQENFDALQKRMKESYNPESVNYDMNWVDDFADWAKDMKTKLPVYTQTMTDVQAAAAAQGINLWRPEAGGGGMSNVIQRQITEETGNELAGLLRMIADDNRGNRDYNKLAVDHLVMIEANTFNTVEELKLAVAELKVISINTQKEYAGALVG